MSSMSIAKPLTVKTQAEVAIGFSATLVNLSDALGESGVLTVSVGERTIFPLIVAAS